MGSELTIPLDADVAKQLEEARRAGRQVDEAVNEAVNETIRRVLEDLTPVTPKPFVVRSRDLGALPGINFDSTSRVLDLLDELDGVYAKLRS